MEENKDSRGSKMKYNVDLEFTAYGIQVEADSEEDAIKQALIKLTNNPQDFFTAEDEYANIILNNFNDYSTATEVDE